MFKLAAATLLALTSTTLAGPYSTYGHSESLTVSPKKIVINAYKAENVAVVAPTKVVAYASFYQDQELYEGDTLQVRFGMVFDPDNIALAPLGTSIPVQNVPVSVVANYVEMSIQSPINLPPAHKTFGGWCTAPGTSYTIDGQIWAQLPHVMSSGSGQPIATSQPIQLVVNCYDKKPVFKIDMSKLPAKVLNPRLNIKITPRLPPR